MADIGYIRSQLRAIPDANLRRILETCFEHTYGNLRFGVPEHQSRATNFQAYWLHSTTASDTGEFSIAHGLPSTPHYAIPILELDRVGSRAGGLTVSRAADPTRIYLKADAGSTNAPVTVLTEW